MKAWQRTAHAARRPPEACGILAGFIYTAIQITVLLLAAGTILGAVWADKAWGHFWSWDPKEVWALVSLLVYMLGLHIRRLGWSRDFGMAVTAVLGFTAILFTWYFVNFVLGSGMHSYGSGAGGQWAVIGALIIEWLFRLLPRYAANQNRRELRSKTKFIPFPAWNERDVSISAHRRLPSSDTLPSRRGTATGPGRRFRA